jgi:AcrR family transcriptional regulator
MPAKALKKPALSPRKSAVQARSQETLRVIHEATIQVLLKHGIDGLTTTRVCERAGVSVGTIYQYYPNKQALLVAVLEHHLDHVIAQLENACQQARGKSMKEMSQALVGSYLDAKLERPDVSLALYAIPSDQGRDKVIAQMTQRAQLAICDLLASSIEARFAQPSLLSLVITTALIGPAQMMVTARLPSEQNQLIREQLTQMIASYLQSSVQESV